MDIIVKVCDKHLHDVNHPGQGYRIKIENDNLPESMTRAMRIDLCDETAEAVLGPVFELLSEHGRPDLHAVTNGKANGVEDKPYKCIPCGKQWKGKISKTKHDKESHGGNDVNPVDQLGSSTAAIEAAEPSGKVYPERVDGLYQCHWCPARLARLNAMRNHVADQHPEHAHRVAYRRKPNPAECPECNEMQGSRQGLASHLKTKHGVEGPLAYCDGCPRAFAGETAQNRRNAHSRVHRTQPTEDVEHDEDQLPLAESVAP